MHPTIEIIRDTYHLEIESPFEMSIGENIYCLQYLIKGYGAKHGMVIDKEWSKLEPVTDQLLKMGYGFSCIDLEDPSCVDFQDVLDDWGVSNA